MKLLWAHRSIKLLWVYQIIVYQETVGLSAYWDPIVVKNYYGLIELLWCNQIIASLSCSCGPVKLILVYQIMWPIELLWCNLIIASLSCYLIYVCYLLFHAIHGPIKLIWVHQIISLLFIKVLCAYRWNKDVSKYCGFIEELNYFGFVKIIRTYYIYLVLSD